MIDSPVKLRPALNGEVVAPEICTGTLEEAKSHADRIGEPVFVPACVYSDDRGWSYMNQMQGVLTEQGQINFSVQYPGVVKAWHRHHHQTDYWMCLQGNLKVGVHRDVDHKSWMIVIGEKRPGVLIIPPTLWHGAATIGPNSAGLLYYVDQSYDPANPDEQRRHPESIPGFSWDTLHR